jgi:hypothetical protein
MQPSDRAWLDDVLDCYFARRPVDATFIGRHDHDHRLPDLSEHATGDALAAMQRLAARVPSGDGLSVVERVDHRLAAGSLHIEIAELQSGQVVTNPAFYTGEAIFGVMSLFLREHAPLPLRLEAATSRLAAVPILLAQGMNNVRTAPSEWTTRAVDECTGGMAFFRDGVDALIAGAQSNPEHRVSASALATFRMAADTASAAIATFGSYLETTLRHRPRADVAAGAEALSLYLREGHALTETAEEIRSRAIRAMQDAGRLLQKNLARERLQTAAQLDERLSSLHPSADKFLLRFQQSWNALRGVAIENDLVGWPEVPVRYVPQPVWARAAAPHLYFLPYRSPSAYDAPAEHLSLVPPIEPDWPEERRDGILRAVNDAVIRLNHVIHHGGLGHHVQNAFARESPSRIGRIAAVDGASRIAFFCGGTMAEGWACYATDLMAEAGALSQLERLSELRSRIRMCARAVVDVSLHLGDFSIAEAAAFYEQQAAMPPPAARMEAVKNSMFPGAALMYFVGRDAIHALRSDLASALGDRFRPRAFHETLLGWGSVPVAVIADAMRTVVRETGALRKESFHAATAPLADGRLPDV